MTACILLIGSGIYGLYTIHKYPEASEETDKTLFILYVIVTIVNFGAGVLEGPNIMKAFTYKDEHGVYLNYGEEPYPIVGHTVYDKLPEKVGLVVFLAITICTWFIWPLYLVNLVDEKKDKENDAHAVGEKTRLII